MCCASAPPPRSSSADHCFFPRTAEAARTRQDERISVTGLGSRVVCPSRRHRSQCPSRPAAPFSRREPPPLGSEKRHREAGAILGLHRRLYPRPRPPPPETDMQRHFQLSPPSVHQMVLTLERLGHIRRQPGVARSIDVLLAPEDLPVLRHSQPVKSSVLMAALRWRRDCHGPRSGRS